MLAVTRATSLSLLEVGASMCFPQSPTQEASGGHRAQVRGFSSLLLVVPDPISIDNGSAGALGLASALCPLCNQPLAAPPEPAAQGERSASPVGPCRVGFFLLITAYCLVRGEMRFGEAGSDKQGGDRSCHLHSLPVHFLPITACSGIG